MTLLQMSFTGAVLILAITVIRALAINKLPKKTFLVLWGIALLRLLIPISVPSALSVYSFLEKNVPSTEYFMPDEILMPITPSAPSAVGHATSLAIVLSGWSILWLIGAVLCAVFFAATYWKCRREFQMSLPVDEPFVRLWLNTHPLKRPLEIRQSSQITAPLTYGIFCPVILMPKSTNWKDTLELEYILDHEYVHIQRFDTATKLFLTLALCVHWFNPLVWVMYILANRDIELSCDETVLRRFGENTRSAYARILVSMEERKNKILPLCNSFSKNAIEERIVAIMKLKKTTIFSLTAAILLVTATTAAFATSAAADDSKPNAETTGTEAMAATYVMDDNGKAHYILDDGRTLDEAEYEKLYPMPDIEWWTHEEYREWLETEKQELPKLIGGKGKANGKEFIWTQEMVDETIAMYEEELQSIKNGALVSKPKMDEEGGCMGITINNASRPSLEYQLILKNGNERVFSYETSEELLAEVQSFCQEQVRLGNMDQNEFDSIMSDLKHDPS